MDYFKILNLTREPFSNSPEPEFFFPSPRHLACLQQLELSIRLKRGLNVVMGDVGTGKSTLCRQLLLRLTEREEDQNDLETHLLLDPSFTDAHEFLTTVSVTLGLPRPTGILSEWLLKEGIKDHLFRKGVDEKKIVVLIIDEGQKLPDFGLEILREFLNYETNENKLLQIVIFAQTEFREVLKAHENFADRVNQHHFIQPLNFRETRALIRFRIARAGKADGTRPLFTLPALWAIHRATGGYPRKIITLCHQILLALIIQNRVRASRRMVLSIAGRLLPVVLREKRWTTAGALAILAVGVLTFVIFFPDPPNIGRNASLTTITDARPTPAITQEAVSLPLVAVPVQSPPPAIRPTNPPAAPKAPARVKPAPESPSAEATPLPAIPSQLGSLKIREGGTVLQLLYDIYGRAGTSRFRALIEANPHIRDMNMVRAGETIHFPAIPIGVPPLRPEKKWVLLVKKNSLDEAYAFYKEYPADKPAIRLVPTWNKRAGLSFLLVLKGGFYSEAGAKDALQDLAPEFSRDAVISKMPAEDTVYFAG